jgi:RNA polymerase sigma-70 factor (ECF subfamily)
MTATERSDMELVVAIARTRDVAAFGELLQRYEGDAMGLAVRITGRVDLAEETVQEAMVRIWTSAATFQRDGSVKAWILRIVARECIRIMKGKRKKLVKMDSDIVENSPAGGISPLKDVETAEISSALRTELEKLPEMQRKLVGLHFGGGLSQGEIGEALSMSQQMVSYHLNAALEALRCRLAQTGYAAVTAVAITQALCEQIEIPSGLHERILEHLSATRPQSFRRKGIPRSARPRVNPLMAAAAVLVTGGVVFATLYFRDQTPGSQPVAKAPEQQSSNSNTPIKPAADWHHRWNFENGLPQDLIARGSIGKWTWNRNDRTIEIPGSLDFFPPYPLPAQPLLITIKGRIIDKSRNTDAAWALMKADKASIVEQSTVWDAHKNLVSVDVTHKLYIYGRRFVSFWDDEFISVRENADTAENNFLVLQLKNFSMLEITAEPLKEEELPDAVRNPKPYMKK